METLGRDSDGESIAYLDLSDHTLKATQSSSTSVGVTTAHVHANKIMRDFCTSKESLKSAAPFILFSLPIRYPKLWRHARDCTKGGAEVIASAVIFNQNHYPVDTIDQKLVESL